MHLYLCKWRWEGGKKGCRGRRIFCIWKEHVERRDLLANPLSPGSSANFLTLIWRESLPWSYSNRHCVLCNRLSWVKLILLHESSYKTNWQRKELRFILLKTVTLVSQIVHEIKFFFTFQLRKKWWYNQSIHSAIPNGLVAPDIKHQWLLIKRNKHASWGRNTPPFTK